MVEAGDETRTTGRPTVLVLILPSTVKSGIALGTEAAAVSEATTTFERYIETTCDLGEVDLETDRDNEVLMVAEIESVLVAEVEPFDNWVAAG